MPVYFQQEISQDTRLGIWKIEEDETFFRVPLQKSITHPHKRLQHLAGRYLLRYLFPGFPLDLIKIADTNKPFLEDEAFHFSISHSGDFVAALVSKTHRVGVDIETISEKATRLQQKFLHIQERKVSTELLQQAGEMNEAQLFTLLWSCKESVFKWWSYGKVDFSDMIRLDCARIHGRKGQLASTFFGPETSEDLHVHYRLFETICLSWIVS